MASTQLIAGPISVEATPGKEAEAVANKEGLYVNDNTTLSTIIRFHKKERLPFLEEALFSLAIQSWRDLETIIVLQNGTSELESAVREMVGHQPWPHPPRYAILSVDIPEGVDGRSSLLNRGIGRASGRYLAFLDDDDVVYQHGYATLIRQLEDGGCAVALGGCRTAKVRYESDHWFVLTKETPFSWGRTRGDLFRDNFVPIHSYVIDRARTDARDIYFDDALPPLEDYDFLLRLCAKYDFDFSQLGTPVCEYRIHGSNSIPYNPDAPPEAFTSHQRAQQLINERKKKILCPVPISELVELQQTLIMCQQEKAAIEERLVGYEREKLYEQGRFLNTVVRKVYTYFGRYPRLEMHISKLTHSGWGAYKRVKALRSGK